MNELEKYIRLGFEKLEQLTEVNWPNNKRITRERLILAFSQTKQKPYKYLGYHSSDGLYNVMTRAIPKIKEYKAYNQEYRNFILELNNMFLCYECNTVYTIFNRVSGTKVKNLCKECDVIRSINKRYDNRQYLYDYLKNNPCIDCGESNPIVLEFDHKNPKEKLYNVANMKSSSIDKINEEISKCDVVCSNCHRIRTAKEQNWYKDLIK